MKISKFRFLWIILSMVIGLIKAPALSGSDGL